MLTDPKTLGIIAIVVGLLGLFWMMCWAAVHQQSDTGWRVLAPTLFEPWSDQLTMFPYLPRMPAPEVLRDPPLRLVERLLGPEPPRLIGEVPQYRRPTPQADSVYAAIVALRKAGHRVEPRGEASHLIDGEQIDYRELIRRARGGG